MVTEVTRTIKGREYSVRQVPPKPREEVIRDDKASIQGPIGTRAMRHSTTFFDGRSISNRIGLRAPVTSTATATDY